MERALKKKNELDLLSKEKTVRAICNTCNKVFTLTIQKKLIEEANFFPITLLFNHDGHLINCYIDKNFVVRATSPFKGIVC